MSSFAESITMPDPVSALRAIPRFAYLSPSDARAAVIAVLESVREPGHRALSLAAMAYDESPEAAFSDSDEAMGAAFRAALDALIAEVRGDEG